MDDQSSTSMHNYVTVQPAYSTYIDTL